jgi:hypothetical protein
MLLRYLTIVSLGLIVLCDGKARPIQSELSFLSPRTASRACRSLTLTAAWRVQELLGLGRCRFVRSLLRLIDRSHGVDARPSRLSPVLGGGQGPAPPCVLVPFFKSNYPTAFIYFFSNGDLGNSSLTDAKQVFTTR